MNLTKREKAFFGLGILFSIGLFLICVGPKKTLHGILNRGRQILKNVNLPLPDFSKKMPVDGILGDFEGKDSVKFEGNVRNMRCTVSNEHASSGIKSLKVMFPKEEYPGLVAKDIPQDWSAFDNLIIDAYNPSENVVQFGILIRDKIGGDPYPNRYDQYFAFRPGQNHFILNITSLKTNDRSRIINVNVIKDMIIFLINPQEETTIYFDNISLTKKTKLNAELRFFNFGPEGSTSWPGSVLITDKTRYSPAYGYGWGNDATNFKTMDRIYPDSLFSHWVQSSGPFLVDLPNGQYSVYMMLEDPGYWEYYQNYEQRTVYANGEIVIHEELPVEKFFTEYYFKHINHEDSPGADIFNDYVQKRFVWRKFGVDVKNKQLRLTFDPAYAYACTLSAMIISPKNKEENLKSFLEELDKQRRLEFYSKHIEEIPQKPAISEVIKKEIENNGFVVFKAECAQDLLPYDIPKENQITEHINVFLAPGEYEPFILGVYSPNDLGDIEVGIAPLLSFDGKSIPSESIEKNIVQYKLKIKKANVYSVKGEILRRASKIKSRKDITRYFWFTIHIPADMPAGEYKGELRLKTDSGLSRNIVLSVNVLPFLLDEPGIALGMFYALPAQYNWYESTKSLLWVSIEKQLQDLRNHNINTLGLMLKPDIKNINNEDLVEFDSNFYDEFLHAYKHFGFNMPISGYGLIGLAKEIKYKTNGINPHYENSLKDAFTQINEHSKQLAGQEMIFVLGDEVSNVGGEGIESVIESAKTLKNTGLKLTAYLNNRKDIKAFSSLNVVTISNDLNINQELLNIIKKDGSDLWFYNIGQDRFTFGYYLWKTKAKGRLQWHYQLPAVDPYFDLDGRESDYCASYPSPDGPINAVWFELIREGIDDYRYLTTLDNLINKAEALHDPTLDNSISEAKSVIAGIESKIEIELDKNKWAPDDYDKYRLQIVNQIIKLKAALSQK